LEIVDKISEMRKNFFFILSFLFFLFGIPFLVFAQCDESTKPPPPDCPPHSFTETANQKITQYNCTKGACGGVIKFHKREGERDCSRNCTTTYDPKVECVDDQWATSCVKVGTSCTNWNCEDWEFKNETTTQTYDTKDTPWLVCTYKYDQLAKGYCSYSYFDNTTGKTVTGKEEYNERKRAGVSYPHDKIKCDENECREVDEITWFPPVFNSDSKDYFEYCVSNRSFFNVSQVTCWGKCLNGAKGPHYFGGSINPKREVEQGKIESEEQDPSAVRLPAKFGWEFKIEKSGMDEWETAIDWAKEKCKTELESKRECPYPSPPYQESEIREIIKRMLKEIHGEVSGEKIFKDKYEIDVDKNRGLVLDRGLGAGSFFFKEPVKKFLPLAEGQGIPDWQTPGSGIGDAYWTRKDMYDYFDYYFLRKTGYSENEVRYGFSGEFEEKLANGEIERRRLFVYSPSQDSKGNFLWVEYQDPNENKLTKQIRPGKIGGKNGPCAITPFKNHNFFVTPCCASDSENCSPQKPNWNFYALGPEMKSILGIRTEEVTEIYPFFHVGTFNKVEGKIYRFIDIDWDRVWPSKLKREENLKYDYFYTGMVSFDQFDGGLNECEKECKKKCDNKCLNICENQCDKECERTFKEEEALKKCKEDCHKYFENVKKERCPTCKSEEREMGCTVCEDCSKEYECTEKCITDCYRDKAAKTGRMEEEFKDCDEVCGENPHLDLVAARGECQKLTSERDKKICQICQSCPHKADYVEIEWCQNFSESPLVTPFYKARIEEKFPIEAFYKRTTSTECENIKTPPLCETKPCQCYKYTTDGKEILEHDGCEVKISDKFLPHPRVRIPAEALEKQTYHTFECAPYPYEKIKCFGIEQLQSYDQFKDSKLAGTSRYNLEKLKVTRDVYYEFGDFGEKQTYSIPISLYDERPWSPQPWWEQDKLYSLFASFVSNSIVVGVENKGSGLRWDFKIKTLPKTQFCNYEKENCFGEKENEYPFCWKITKRTPEGYLPPEKEFDKEKKQLGIYRTESIQTSPVDRILSLRLKIKFGESFLEYLPKIPTQSPLIGFPLWEIWNSLPPLKDALGRLKKEFSFFLYPCGDENGFFCLGDYVQQKVKITGEPPPFPFKEETSGPPPPKKIRIPHYFNWDASLGAASYWLKIGEKEIFHPDIWEVAIFKSNKWVDWLKEDTSYYWQVKTCADLCSKDDLNLLQCGEWSEKIGPVVGYYLNPPSEMLNLVQFFPNEEITIWWKPIAKGTDCTHLRITYKGGVFEKRKDCIEKAMSTLEGYIVLAEIKKGDLDGKFTIPKELLPTSTEIFEDKTTGMKTNICLGDYYYQIRYCTGEDCYKKKENCKTPEDCKKEGGNYLDCVDCYYSAECQEAGPWSYLASFEIVTKKYEKRGGGGGFGTCRNLIPCTECHFGDIPKIISNIISCILWTLSPIAMVLLLLYTGISIYFSFGSPEVIEKAKSIWKAVGIGWLIMLFSWMIVNLIGETFKMPGWK
jgi:hypothetical protein